MAMTCPACKSRPVMFHPLNGQCKCPACLWSGPYEALVSDSLVQAAGVAVVEACDLCDRCRGAGEILGDWDYDARRYWPKPCPECLGAGKKIVQEGVQ